MEKFENYSLLERLEETKGSIVYRGQKEGESNTVIIKLLKKKDPSPAELARFRHEYKIIKDINLDSVVKILDIIEHRDSIALVLEDFNGVSIKNITGNGKEFSIKVFLDTAVKIAEALGDLHKMGIVHRDIKPGNILINTDLNMVKITDFGISAEFTGVNEEINDPDVIHGTLPYMSPEQTGRMNRPIDYRSDLYSLGITFYEMLIGRVPFDYSDPMTLIYSHIAITPLSPDIINPHVPEMLSRIVMKLLSKNTESRYQNSYGLMADLEECRRRLDDMGDIDRFELGAWDISSRFIFPQRLFGRERDMGMLISSFEKLYIHSKSPYNIKPRTIEVMLVSGEPGIGKSALLNELHRHIIERRGYFISGKFEQFGRDKPYSAVIQAFRGLARQLLAESNENITAWRNKLLNALGGNGKVITDIIPEIELIIGRQPRLTELGAHEARNRFNFVFEKFASVFSSEERPLVLSMDDMQWADIPSLDLLRNLAAGSDINYLFIIGSYRNNEVGDTHPLTDFIREVEKEGINISTIILGPLSVKDINDLLKNFLKCSDQNGIALSGILQRKTGGNPFFIIQFLKTLYGEKLIELDPRKGWTWDIDSISRMKLTDNVVDFLVEKISSLPPGGREALKACSVIGSSFDLETLSMLLNMSIDSVLEHLIEVLNEGYISFFYEQELYIFQHDHIQEAAYSLLTPDERTALHYRIGRFALDRTGGEPIGEKLFYIVDHLNLGSGLMADHKEIQELVRLNLEAGKRAKSNAAFWPAYKYLENGIRMLKEDSWAKSYELASDLHAEAVEVCYMIGDYEKMNILADTALKRARSLLYRARIIETKINACKARKDFKGAVDMGFPITQKLLRISIRRNISEFRARLSLLRSLLTIRNKKEEYFLNLPEMTDPMKLAGMKLLANVGHAAYFIAPGLYTIGVIKALLISFKHGISPAHPFIIAAYGALLNSSLGDINGAYKFGNIALKMLDMQKEYFRTMSPRTIWIYNMLIRHWKEPLAESLDPAIEGYRQALEIGDLEHAAWNLHIYATFAPLCGKTLDEFESDLTRHNAVMRDVNQEYIQNIHSVVWQYALCMLGRSGDPVRMKGKALDEDQVIPVWKEENNSPALAVYYFLKICLCFFFNEYPGVLEYAPEYRRYKKSIAGAPLDVYFYLLESISKIIMYRFVPFWDKIKYYISIRREMNRFKRLAKITPVNYLHFYYALQATYAINIELNKHKARKIIDAVIGAAVDNSDPVFEAIANDNYALYFLSIGENDRASRHITAAYSGFSRWGAAAKLKQIEERYGSLIKLNNIPEEKKDYDITDSASSSFETFDLLTVIQSSQALSREINLERLLVKMTDIIMKNSGADRCFMILQKRKSLFVEAEGTAEGDISALRAIPLEMHTGLSQNIVNYTSRTGETLLLNNAINEGGYVNDPHILRNRPKSILCLPVINQGKLSGILYLENNLTTDAFTPKSLDLLNILSSQMAVSIDNARLYENLEEEVKERTEELHMAMQEMAVMNEKLIGINRQLEETNKKLEQAQYIAGMDMDMAVNVQTSLFPESPPSNRHWDLAFAFRPMSGVSGDLYDFFEKEGELKGLVIADVSGHGIASGLITMIARSIFYRNFFKNKDEDLSRVMERVNTDLINEIGNVSNYLTGIILRFKGNDVEYVNAGHADMAVKRSSSRGKAEIISPGIDGYKGYILGFKDMEGMYRDFSCKINRDDTLLLFTDGLVESKSPEGEKFGMIRLLASLENAPEQDAQSIIEFILNDFYKFLNDNPIGDDVTIIAARKKD